MIMNNEVERTRKEAVEIYLVSTNLTGGSEESNENPPVTTVGVSTKTKNETFLEYRSKRLQSEQNCSVSLCQKLLPISTDFYSIN
jgi:hypothetical protein